MSPASRVRRPAGGFDLAVVAVLVVVSVIGFGPAWGGTGYLVAALGALVLGLALAWWGAWRHVSILSMAAATIVTYMLAGGALALPSTTVLGVVPTLATLRGLLLGAVDSWKDLVTAATPLSAFPALLVVPFLATLVVSVLAGTVALRAPRPAWVLLPTGVLLVGVILLGSRDAAMPVAQGTVFALVALGWTAWRTAQLRHAATSITSGGADGGMSRALRTRRLTAAAAILVVAGVGAAAAAPVFAPSTPRLALRDVVVPPLDLHDYPSPLVAFRTYVRDDKDKVLFTVDGLPAGARVRLATLDAYTGTVIDVAGGADAAGSGKFGRAGGTLPGQVSGTPAGLTVTIGAYRGVWLPDAGQPSAIHFTGPRGSELTSTLHYNPTGATALSTAGLTKGDRYTVQTVLPTVPDAAHLKKTPFATVELPAPVQVPKSVSAAAASFVGSATAPVDQVEGLRDALVKSGMFSDGLDGQPKSRAGHGTDRIETLLGGDHMVGDDEQFAVAMTLMARQLGIPARVVMGFYPGKDAPAHGTTYQVRGTDVHAWVEIDFEGVGWVPFDASPDANIPPQQQDPRSQTKPEPQPLQPPPPPEEPAVAPLQPIPDPARDEVKGEGLDWGRYLGLVAEIVIPIGIVLAPFVLILAFKMRRRLRRRQSAATADRISGGWSEVVDTAVDLGLRAPPAGGTRREAAAVLVKSAPASSSAALAARADAGVFGPGDPTHGDVEAYWSDVSVVQGELSAGAGRWRRLRARFSLRSLRGGASWGSLASRGAVGVGHAARWVRAGFVGLVSLFRKLQQRRGDRA